MERLTRRDDDSCARYGLGPNQNVIDRLALIEDILGDDYDLDRLREIVQKNIKYEQTGLEPEEIERLKGEAFGLKVDKQELEQYRAIGPIDRMQELVEADRDGRCLVFQANYPVAKTYAPEDEDGLYTMTACGVVRKEEYEAALKGEHNGKT